MRCLIYAKSSEAEWLKEYFPDVEPFLLKIVNKSLLEYVLDLLTLLGISEIRIVSDSSIKAIEKSIGDGAKWGARISYALARPEDNLKNVYLKNFSFCKESPLLIWNGFFFAQYNRNAVTTKLDWSQAFSCGERIRMIFLPAGERLGNAKPANAAEKCLDIREIESIVDYYKLSMDILVKHNSSYVLPGYTNEKDTFLGLNLVYPHSCELHAPIMIGNNCRFQRKTLIGPNSIIGNNVIIDENTCVTDSIVYDNTYIGKDLDLDKKIVYKSNLISAVSGESIHITDNVLVSQVELGIVTSYLNRVVQRIFALSMMLIQLIPWLILYLPYCLMHPKTKTERLMNRNMRVKRFTDSILVAESAWGRLMIRLSLDKFDLLFSAAVTGKLYLVGNKLFSNTVQHRKLINDLPAYNPGVFSLSETVNALSPDVEGFYELEYIDKISTLFNLKIFFVSIFRRLIWGLNATEETHEAIK